MFSWDPAKATRNSEKHGVSFDEAATVFGDANALDWVDLRIQEKKRVLKGSASLWQEAFRSLSARFGG